MYEPVENSPRMTANAASERYRDNYILMQMDGQPIFNPLGTVLYIGDDGDELFDLQISMDIPYGLVVDGITRQQSLGGIVVGT